MTYEEAVKELYRTIVSAEATNYHACLYRLIQKADPENKARLRAGYPQEVKAFEDWQSSARSLEFFDQYLPERGRHAER